MPKSRPGVEASCRLSKITDIAIWMSVEKQYGDMLLEKGGKKLVDLDKICEEISLKWQRIQQKEDGFCTCQDLYTIMEWKFATGKPRPLWKHIKSNLEDAVRALSKDAFALVRHVQSHDENVNTAIGNAVETLSKLKGIGPASASAILSLYRPDLMVFMYDEILDCFLGERKYTTAAYIKINTICRNLVRDLGGNDTSINVRKLGQILWSAARLSLCEDKVDLTLGVISCKEVAEKGINDEGKDMVEIKVKRIAERKIEPNESGEKEDCDDPQISNPVKSVKRRKT